MDSTESCSDPVRDIKLPEQVNVLFCQTVESSDLPLNTIKGLKQLMYDHKDTFATSSADLGFCDILRHDIDTGDARPFKQSPRRPPLAAKDAEDQILGDMLQTGVIEPSNSIWASPVCLVKKVWDILFLYRLQTRKHHVKNRCLSITRHSRCIIPPVRCKALCNF